MSYADYIHKALDCKTPEEADHLIDRAANDWTLTALQYQNIRSTALFIAYNN